VVFQQIHLVHVEEIAVGVAQEPGLEALFPVPQGMLDVQGSHKPVFGDAQGELHHPHLFPVPGERSRCLAFPAVAAQVPFRVALEAALPHRLQLRQELGQCPDRRALCGPLLAHHQQAADAWIYYIEYQGGLQFLLPHDCGKGKDHPSASAIFFFHPATSSVVMISMLPP